jgi:DNA-binding winged helix-turn-helix (wHTH) protein
VEPSLRLCFRDCVLDTGTRALTRGGVAVPLSPKTFRLLEVLMERRPNAVPHDALRALLWPDAVTGGTTLARVVNDLRTALGDGDDAEPIIRTVHRFGYAFAAVTTEDVTVTRVALCAIKWGSLFVPLTHGGHVIGRASTSVITVPSSKVSRQHSRLTVSEERTLIEDLGSHNGTYVNDERIAAPVTLKHGDRIGIGPAVMIFSAAPDDATTSQDNRS